jgi:ABC-2 type transport system permease protein
MSIFHNHIESLNDLCYIWRQEVKQMFKDEGVIIFFIVVPLLYPLLYSWIYNNEVVREVPVVVVDQSSTPLSREFIRKCDASPDVKVYCHAADMDEAQSLVSRQIVKGVYLIPSDFETRLNRMEQATVSVYCDMSLMLAYKAIFQTAQAVAQQMGSGLTTRLGGHYTLREEQIAAKPLDFEEVAIFNPTGGYGSSILPGVLILIIQQTLVLGIGLAAGTAREDNRFSNLIPLSRHYHGMFRIVGGKALAYFMIYAVIAAYLVLIVPWLFGFTAIGQWQPLLAVMIPYLLDCIFFGMVVSCLVRYRENVMLLMVFVSLPLLFLTGISWPQSSMPGFWQGISWLFPSTFGVRAYVRVNVMGSSLSDILPEYQTLWLQTLVYFIVACLVYRYQIHLTRQAVRERLARMRASQQPC